jgi:tRNA A-37 threonylcarbamoyl transferase component Bud32
MGRVELALRADQLDRDICVIKRMHSEGRSDDQEARFRREAQIAVRLENDNIARTLRVEDINGEPCLAQEFVEGVDLGGIMRQFRPRNLPVAAAVYVVSEVCRGLGYAHDFGGHGIVHRDVTPENIMVSFDGKVKLIDFGIARSAVDGTLTNVGVIIGRREYIAPESWEGEKADRRVDIYALGVVLWELLTGRRLEGSTEVGPGKRPPDPSTVNAGIPPAVGQVVIRALAEAPNERFQNAEEFRAALAPFGLPETNARADLVELLRANFQVDLLRDLLAQDVAEARQFLTASTAPSIEEPLVPVRSFRLRGALITAGVATLVLVVGMTLLARPREIRPMPKAIAAVEPAPTLTPPAASPGSTAAEPPPATASTGDGPPRAVSPAPARGERRGRRTPSTLETPSAKVAAPSGEELVRQAQNEWDRGNDAAALTLLRQARGSSGAATARVLAGAILIGEEKLPEAEQELSEALRLDPDNARAKNLLAMAREKMERR